jgi:hypothetical protein
MKYPMRGKRGGARAQRLKKWASKANAWLKKTKLISRATKGYNAMGLPYGGIVGKVGNVASVLGYGRRKTRVRRMRRIRY